MKGLKFISILLLAMAVFSCEKQKMEPLVFEYEDSVDAYYKFKFKSPKGWAASADPGHVQLLSSQDAYNRFADPNSPSVIGGMIKIDITTFEKDTTGTVAMDSSGLRVTLAQFADKIKAEDREWLGDPPYDKESDVQVAGYPAKKMEYKVAVTKGMILKSEKYAVVVDTLGYLIEFKSYNEMFEQYMPAFNTLVGSLEIPRALPKTAEESAMDIVLPSKAFLNYNGGNITMKYPDNFNASKPAKQGDAEFAVMFQGYRVDCTVLVDVLPAKGLTVEKVFGQSEAAYKSKSKGEAKIGGEKAMYINYSVMKDVGSRVYFSVKGDKIYRVTMNWHKPMEKDFLPVFEQMVASIGIK